MSNPRHIGWFLYDEPNEKFLGYDEPVTADLFRMDTIERWAKCDYRLVKLSMKDMRRKPTQELAARVIAGEDCRDEAYYQVISFSSTGSYQLGRRAAA